MLLSKGTEADVNLQRWWINQKKRNFIEMLDDYKYPLTKILSYDQIAAMRKTL